MSGGAGTQGFYRIGNYRVDPEQRRVFNGNGQVAMTWRTFEALRLMIEAGGEVVPKEILFEKLWPGVTVEESSLTKCIGQLRKALSNGENGDGYVETVPRVGYRLSVAVKREAQEVPVPAARGKRKLVWVGAAAVAVLGLVGVAGWRFWQGREVRAEAERLYQEGRRLRRNPDAGSLQGAIEAFRKAAAQNPGKAIYFSTLAEALGQVSSPASDLMDWGPMRQAAERSVALDARCGACQAVLGFTLFSRYWEWEAAERHLHEALKLAPEGSGLRGYWAMYESSQGRLPAALDHIEAGLVKEPYAATLHQIKAMVLYYSRRYAEAIAAADRALAINPQHRAAWDFRAHSLKMLGREKEALTAYVQTGWADRGREVEAVYSASGFSAALQRLLDVTSGAQRQWYRRAQWQMHRGEHAAAVEELENAFRFRHFNMIYVAVDPVFEPIRGDARVRKIVEEMRLLLPQSPHGFQP